MEFQLLTDTRSWNATEGSMNPKHFVKGGILTKQKGGCSQVGLVSSPKPQDKRKWVQVVLGRFRWDFRICFFSTRVVSGTGKCWSPHPWRDSWGHGLVVGLAVLGKAWNIPGTAELLLWDWHKPTEAPAKAKPASDSQSSLKNCWSPMLLLSNPVYNLGCNIRTIPK